MKVQSINNNTFEAKKFRLPLRGIDLTNPDLIQYGRITKKVNMVKEYSNPKAEFFYNQAKNSNNIKEKMDLYAKMGDFEIYDFGNGPLGAMRMKIYLALAGLCDFFDK